jgi:hypothetical protein
VVRQRDAGLRGLVEEDELVHRAHPPAAVLDRPADAEPAVGAEAAVDLAVGGLLPLGVVEPPVGLRRHQLGEVGTEFGAESLLLGRVVAVHRGPLGSARSGDRPPR